MAHQITHCTHSTAGEPRWEEMFSGTAVNQLLAQFLHKGQWLIAELADNLSVENRPFLTENRSAFQALFAAQRRFSLTHRWLHSFT